MSLKELGRTQKNLEVFLGKFRKGSGKVLGKRRKSSRKVPEISGKFWSNSGNRGQVPEEDSGIGLALKFWQIQGEFWKFRESSGISGEVMENSGQVPGKFQSVPEQVVTITVCMLG